MADDKPLDKVNLAGSGLNLAGVLTVGFLAAGRLDAVEARLGTLEQKFEPAIAAQRVHKIEGHPKLSVADERLDDKLERMDEDLEDLVDLVDAFGKRIAMLEACLNDARCRRQGVRR